MEITDGTQNDKSFNTSGTEILIKENVPCNVDIPSLLPSLFKYVCFHMERGCYSYTCRCVGDKDSYLTTSLFIVQFCREIF